MTDLAALLADSGGVLVLDGGLATELERSGHDLGGGLWSARLLADDPDAIRGAHERFFRAGAQVATTASYQASFEGLAAVGVDRDEAERLFRRSVQLARSAAEELPGQDEPRVVAASVGPYGAMLAGGQEYTGDYGPDMGVRELRAWHRPRLEVLADAGADVLALETVPSLAETEALLLEIAALDVPAWLSLTCAGTSTRRGEPAAEAFAMAGEVPAVVAVGVNCSDPRDVTDLVALAAAASGKPAVAYPNSGETWDAVGRAWTGTPDFDPDAVDRWTGAGARLVGGCCRVGPAEIEALAQHLRGAAAR